MGRVRVGVLRVGSGTGTKSTGRVYPFLPVKNTIFHDVGATCISNVLFYFFLFSEITFATCRRPSVCLSSVTFVPPTQGIEIFGIVLRHLIRWPSIDIQVKFYGVRPRGTCPSVELKTRGVTEYSDFGPIERFISETVQDRS